MVNLLRFILDVYVSDTNNSIEIRKKYMRMPCKPSLTDANNLLKPKSKSYTHNRLERFITLQNLTSVVQRLRSLTMAMDEQQADNSRSRVSSGG